MPRTKGTKLVRCNSCGVRMYLAAGTAKVCKCGRLVSRPTQEVKCAEVIP